MQGIIGDVWDCIPHPAPNNHSTEICESLLSACPVFCCRSLRKLFLPDSLRRSGFPWCALVLAALHRKVILACSRRFCCQGTLVFNLRIGESPFRKVLSKSLQIFCKIRVKVVLLHQFWQNIRFPPHSSTALLPATLEGPKPKGSSSSMLRSMKSSGLFAMMTFSSGPPNSNSA